MRIARYTPPGEVHHVISRFVEKRWFITSDEERSYYLRLLGNALAKSDWTCLAYAVMSSHIHLAMIAGDQPSSGWSRRVNPAYANFYNDAHDRIGPVFAGRADMWIESTERVARLIAYIHNNPVRAGVVPRAVDSNWTSHRAYTGRAPTPRWLDRTSGLALSGLHSDEFDDWVCQQREPRRAYQSLHALDREAKRLGQVSLGTPISKPLSAPLLARPFARLRPTPEHVVEVVRDVSGVRDEVLLSKSRVGVGIRAVVVKAGCKLGISKASMGAVLALSAQGAAKLGDRVLDPTNARLLDVVIDRVTSELSLVAK
ncbi:MAG: hypothetical protein JO257_30500 [Deltaproteobacteria bacterium]|nr:hypothetical protein [Deltaproteobacteria bacterium]